MKKTITLVITSMLIIFGCITVISANENLAVYDAYDANVKILYNSKEIEFKNKPFIIEGATYVPLRELAEKQGVNVEWMEDTRVIDTWTPIKFDESKLVSNYLGYNISGNSEIIAYDVNSNYIPFEEYGITQNDCFAVKIKLDEKDKNNLLDFLMYYFEEPCSKDDFIDEEDVNPEYLKSQYSWWDIENITDNDIIFFTPEYSEKSGFAERIYIIRNTKAGDYLYGAYISNISFDEASK